MRWPGFFVMAICLVFASSTFASETEITQARTLRESGEFKKAAALLNVALSESELSKAERKRLNYELDLLDRIRRDFSLSEEGLFAALTKSVRDIDRAEFDRWLREKRFESRQIDGETFYTGTSVSNLFWRHPELEPRRTSTRDRSTLHRAMLENARAIKRAVGETKKPYVMPHELDVTMTVTARSNAVPVGEIIRAWLPIPRKFPFQDGFKLIESSSPVKHIADEEAPIRSIYMEQPSVAGGNRFQIRYTYTTHAIRFELDETKFKPGRTDDPSIKPFLAEAPHVVFTPEIKALARKIVGREDHPVRKARLIYNWIGTNILYSYALEYSTIPNISQYCATKGYGDCGQQALLFITLCRASGIPARWQSGWFLFPGGKTIHDWTEIHLEPWGWVPVDVEVGGAFLKYALSLTPDERKELHDFYFGGLDQYRMMANSDHSQTLNPPKRTFRSDDVDFQRGELEWGTQNLYFDQYSYSLQWKVK